ncbi:MAG: hypothetical protein MJZ11_11250 [Lachnospiraceae bacterium]|nr:hypothetical protein [Lachnospiraceae bacterium]
MADEFNAFEEPNMTQTMEETDKKCPACGGTMDFDPATGGLHCPYCDHYEEIKRKDEEEPVTAAELKLEEAEHTANCDWGIATKTVICKSCGAESVYDVNDLSAVCPYCGSNQVMEASDSNTMAPGGVVPFKIDEKEAANRFTSWIKGKFFAPKLAKESAKAKNFKGIYLPYWTFDADTSSTYTGEYGKDRKVKDKEGNVKTVTDWYNTSGQYDHFYDDELVCGTTQHDTGMLRGIEPYNTADNKAYKPEYVAGFGAEKYSVGVKAAWEKAKAAIKLKIRSSVDHKILSDNNADHVRNVRITSEFSNLTYKYLLLPVWLSSYKYKDKVYQFMVNGQTGKVSGRAPVSVIKVILTILVIIGVIVLISSLNN